MIEKFLKQITPFFLAIAAFIAFAFSLYLLFYLFLFGALLGFTLFIYAKLRQKIVRDPRFQPPGSSSTRKHKKNESGRIIDASDWTRKN